MNQEESIYSIQRKLRQQAQKTIHIPSREIVEKPLKIFFERMGEVRPEPIEWLVEGIIPLGMLGIIFGKPGDGKSSILRCITAHLAKGKGCLSYKEGPIESAWLLAEDIPGSQIVPALIAEGCSREEIDRVLYVHGIGTSSPTDGFSAKQYAWEALEEFLDENPLVKLLIIDPLAGWVSNSGLSMKESEDARATCGKMQELCVRRKISCVVLAHEVKGLELSGASRLSGSAQHVASGRYVWQVKKMANGVTMEMVKKNIPYTATCRPLFKIQTLSEQEIRQLASEQDFDLSSFTREKNWDVFHRQTVSFHEPDELERKEHDLEASTMAMVEGIKDRAKTERKNAKIQMAKDAIVAYAKAHPGKTDWKNARNVILAGHPSLSERGLDVALDALADSGEAIHVSKKRKGFSRWFQHLDYYKPKAKMKP
jgi:hypothetical protein